MKQRFYRLLASVAAIIPTTIGKPAAAADVPTCCMSIPGSTTAVPGCTGLTIYNCGAGKSFNACTSCASGYTLSTQTGTTNCGAITYKTCTPSVIPIPTCNAGQYRSGYTCVPCPGSGTSYSGATSITQCFIPSGEGFSDLSGRWTYAENCYYKN